MTEVQVTATADLKVSVNAEQWARTLGIDPSQVAPNLARVLKDEVLPKLGSLIPGLAECGGEIEVTPTRWIASAEDEQLSRLRRDRERQDERRRSR